MSQYSAVGLGNAIMDALVRVPDDAVIERFGLARGQMTPVDDVRWQEVRAALHEHGIELASGGSCANTIAAMGLLGASVSFAGRIGSDSLGEAYTQSLADACGRHDLQVAQGLATGKCLSIISQDAERTMLTDLVLRSPCRVWAILIRKFVTAEFCMSRAISCWVSPWPVGVWKPLPSPIKKKSRSASIWPIPLSSKHAESLSFISSMNLPMSFS